MDEAPPVNHITEDAFFDALGSSDLKALRYLMDQGISPNVRTPHGQPALIVATMNQDAEVVRLLLDAGAEVDARDQSQRSALFYSVAQNTNSIQELLLDAGAAPDAFYSEDPPLSPFTLAVLQGNLTAMHRILDQHRPKVSESALSDALFFAGFYNQHLALKYLLEDAQVSALSLATETTLRFLFAQASASSGYQALVRWLGEHDLGYWQRFPLPFWMAMMERGDLLRLLLDHGVRPDHVFLDEICLPKVVAMTGSFPLINVLVDLGWNPRSQVAGGLQLKSFLSKEGFDFRHRNLLRALRG